MRKYFLIFTILVTSIMIGSCSSSDNKTAESTLTLTKTKWVLKALNGVRIFTPESGKDVYLIMEATTDKANGSGGCNNFSTSYILSGKNLKFGLVASTDMFCQNSMETEKDFLTALGNTRSYKIKGNELYLSDSSGVIAKLEATELNTK